MSDTYAHIPRRYVLHVGLVTLFSTLILWTPVFALLSKVGIELPLSAMVTAALLSWLPVLIPSMVLGRITFVYFPLPVALFAFVTSVVLARRYSFDSDGALRT